jgi:hypothetical protein
MAKPRPLPRKSERTKVIVAVALAAVLVIVLVSQFSGGDRGSDEIAVTPVVGGSTAGEQPALKASGSHSKMTTGRAQNGIGRANGVRETIGGPKVTLGKAVHDSRELLKVDHEAIAQHNPFYEQTELPASDLAAEAEVASAGEEEHSELAPQIRALYVTPDGAVALVDGRIVPVSDSKVAIETIRAKWGNDFSQDLSATEK